MAVWIMFKLGKDWGYGNGEELYVRADSILAVTQSIEHENESILDLGEGGGPYNVIGDPKEIARYIMESQGKDGWANSLYYFGVGENEGTSS